MSVFTCKFVSIQTRFLPETFIAQNANVRALTVNNFLVFVKVQKELSRTLWAFFRSFWCYFFLSWRHLMCSHVCVELVACMELKTTVGTCVRFNGCLVCPRVLRKIRCSVVGAWTFVADEVAGVKMMSEVILKVVVA